VGDDAVVVIGQRPGDEAGAALFATLKKELVHRRSWPTRRELSGEVFEYVEAFYNRTRRHSTLDYLSPADYEPTAHLVAIPPFKH
jgi:transposase InsO family protein